MEEQQKYEVAEIPAITKDIIDQYLYGSGTKLTEPQKAMFLQVAQINGLNPFKREVYAIPRKNKDTGEYSLSIVTGYEVYLKRAERSGKLSGWSADVIKDGSELVGACTIYRKDWKEPLTVKAWYAEYNQGNKMWREKPRTMIRKVAIAQAFRMAFPEELGGMPYTADEMPAIDVNPEPAPQEVASASDKILKAIQWVESQGLTQDDAVKLMGEPITENNLGKLKKVFKAWQAKQTENVPPPAPQEAQDTIACPDLDGEPRPIPYCNTECAHRDGCPAHK